MESLKLSQKVKKIVQEYRRLATRRHLSEQEADRMDEILVLADNEPALSFWIAEADHALGHSLELLTEENRNSYKNQQALLREHLKNEISKTPVSGKPSVLTNDSECLDSQSECDHPLSSTVLSGC